MFRSHQAPGNGRRDGFWGFGPFMGRGGPGFDRESWHRGFGPDFGDERHGGGRHRGGGHGPHGVRDGFGPDFGDERCGRGMGRHASRGGFGHGFDGEHGRGHGFGPGGGRGGHGGPGGGRGGRGLGRFFAHGDLRLVVLQLIAEKPRHGYEIIKAIEDQVAGAYSPSPGVVYPTLTMLEDLGYVTVTEAGGKKLHEITDLGRAFLDANRPALDGLLARMDAVRGGERPHGGAHVFEAMQRLKLALRQQLARPDVDEARIAAAVAAIEAAAAVVEGLE